jgi:hypothetical protein
VESIGSSGLHNEGYIWVPHTFCQKTASSAPLSNSIKIIHQGSSRDTRSNDCYEGAGCARAGPFNSKFRIKRFSGPEKRWGHTSGLQLEAPQQVCTCRSVSSHKHVQGARLPATTGLAGKAGSSQRILPYPSQYNASKIPEDNIPRSAMAGDLPPFRTLDFAKNVCFSYQLDSADTQITRNKGNCLFRRLSPCMPESSFAPESGSPYYTYSEGSRLGDKLQKIDSSPPAVDGVLGSSVGSLEQPEVSSERKDPKFRAEMSQNTSDQVRLIETTTILTRPMQFCQLRSSERSSEQQDAVNFLQPAARVESQDKGKVSNRSGSRVGMVDQLRKYHFPHSPSGASILSDDGCVGTGLGRSAQQQEVGGSVVRVGVRSTLQSLGNDCSTEGNNLTKSNAGTLITNDHVRQSDGCIIPSQRGRHEVSTDDGHNISGAEYVGPPSYLFEYTVHPRKIQHGGRSAFEVSGPVRMASPISSDRTNISGMGYSGGRSLRIQESPRGSSVCDARFNGSRLHVRRCVQPEMEVPVSMDISSAVSDPASSSPPERSRWYVPIGSAEVGEGVLAQRPEEPISGSSHRDSQLAVPVSRHSNSKTSNRCQANSFGSLADTGWATLLDSWDDKQKSLLASGWRKSSLASYKPAWLRWCRWCDANNISKSNPIPQDFARFLTDLYLVENLSHSTICLHKSVVSTFCPVQSGPPLSSHVLVRQALKAIALSRPKPHKGYVWDVKDLCAYLENNEPCQSSLFEASKRCAILLLLSSGRRVHDLTLLNIDESYCKIESECIIFWPEFGSKTDNALHRQSGWKLLKCQSNQNIDPVYWIKMLITLSRNRRGNLNNLFISTCGVVKPASRTIIGGWVKSVLKDANIQGSAGSVRSAVASSGWLNNHNINDILERGNWQSASTFHRFYRKAVAPLNTESNPLDTCFEAI